MMDLDTMKAIKQIQDFQLKTGDMVESLGVAVLEQAKEINDLKRAMTILLREDTNEKKTK